MPWPLHVTEAQGAHARVLQCVCEGGAAPTVATHSAVGTSCTIATPLDWSNECFTHVTDRAAVPPPHVTEHAPQGSTLYEYWSHGKTLHLRHVKLAPPLPVPSHGRDTAMRVRIADTESRQSVAVIGTDTPYPFSFVVLPSARRQYSDRI